MKRSFYPPPPYSLKGRHGVSFNLIWLGTGDQTSFLYIESPLLEIWESIISNSYMLFAIALFDL